MKKIFFPILFFSIAILQSCSDFNERNFPGYANESLPKQVTTATYQLTNTDYKTISTAALKIATNAADSTKAKNIANNLSFSANEPASTYVLLIMPTLYKFADPGSAITITYRTTDVVDPITYNVVYKDSVVAADYTAMGTGTGKPGIGDFSSTVDPNLFLPTYCKTKHPYAVPNEVAKVAFIWYVNSTTQLPLVRYYKFDGSNWVESGKSDQFIKGSDQTWVFDPTVTFIPTSADYLSILNYYYAGFTNNGGVAPTAPATTPAPVGFLIPELASNNGWTPTSLGRFVINWKFPPSGSDMSNVYTEYWGGTSWKYLDIDIRATGRVYADDIELHNYFAQVDSTTLSSTDKTAAKTTFMEQRVIQSLALMISLKYPSLPAQVKGINQIVQVKIDEYDGGHKYWIYRYQCMGPASSTLSTDSYKYIERIKWK